MLDMITASALPGFGVLCFMSASLPSESCIVMVRSVNLDRSRALAAESTKTMSVIFLGTRSRRSCISCLPRRVSLFMPSPMCFTEPLMVSPRAEAASLYWPILQPYLAPWWPRWSTMSTMRSSSKRMQLASRESMMPFG